MNINLVDAQQARRVLDRLVGYELSPLLWKKVARGLSAGRVQSVAVRLIAEREREIEAFKVEEYWTIEGIGSKGSQDFPVAVVELNGKKLKKFDLKEEAAKETAEKLKNAELLVKEVNSKSGKRAAPTPFTTSSLQIEANRTLGFSAKQTMRLAQQLYEGVSIGKEGQTGLITYMRTDSLNLSNDFIDAAQKYIGGTFGNEYETSG